MADNKGRFFGRLETKILCIILLTTLAASLAVFSVTSAIFRDIQLKDFRNRTRAVSLYATTVITAEGFSLLKERADDTLPAYTSQKNVLNSIRDIANVRYLFTAARRPSGTVVYVIDGLDSASMDFRYINDPVEEEILPQVNACLDGKTINAEGILDTSWGAILLTCVPVRDNGDAVVGAVVMEFDAEGASRRNRDATIYSVVLALGIAGLFILIGRLVLRRVSEPFYKKMAYMDFLTGLNNRMAFELDLRKLEQHQPFANAVSIVIYDLNDLKMVNDTQGHSAGDAYLRHMAELITGIFPDSRQSYRLGGDEFATIVQGADSESLTALLEEYFHNSLSLHPEKYFAFSFGVGTYDPARDKSLRDVFNRADKNMYAFKAECKRKFSACAGRSIQSGQSTEEKSTPSDSE